MVAGKGRPFRRKRIDDVSPESDRRTRTFEFVWERRRTGDSNSSNLRLNRGEGWQTFESIDDLPPEVQSLVRGLIDANTAPGELAIPTLETDSKRRPRTRSREEGGTLHLEYIWYRLSTAILSAIGAAGVGTVSVMALQSNDPSARIVAWGGLALAVVIAYYTLALLANRIAIEVSPELLTVRHGPLPWFGNRVVNPADLTQLFCTVASGKAGIAFKLIAETQSGTSITLLDEISSWQEAVRLERSIEKHLGIEDWPRYGM